MDHHAGQHRQTGKTARAEAVAIVLLAGRRHRCINGDYQSLDSGGLGARHHILGQLAIAEHVKLIIERPPEPVVGEIRDRVARVEPEQHRGVLGDTPDPQQGDGSEPRRHHRAEGTPDARGPLRLDGEQRTEDRDRRRHHIEAETWGRDGQPFERREHGNRRGDGAVPRLGHDVPWVKA
jgi:hypothetical protein